MTNLDRLEAARKILHGKGHDISPFLHLIDTHSAMIYIGEGLPFHGIYTGEDGFKDFFERLFSVRNNLLECQRIRFDGHEDASGRVFTEGISLATNPRTGHSLSYEWYSDCTFDHGRIGELTTIVNASPMLELLEELSSH